MTVEELTVLLAGDPQTLISALAPLQESDRRKLAKHAAEWAKCFRTGQDGKVLAELKKVVAPPRPKDAPTASPSAMANIAVLGLCGWTEAKVVVASNQFHFGAYGSAQLFCEMLVRRNPDWIQKVVDHLLAEDTCDWNLVRYLVNAGVVPKPTGDRYILHMVRRFGSGRLYRAARTPLDLLREDPSLLDDELWRIFDLDLSRQVIFAEGGPIDIPERWTGAFLVLMADKTINRDRFLAAILGLLSKPIHSGNLVWIDKLLTAMRVLSREWLDNQHKLIGLLYSATPSIVTLALDKLKQIASSEAFDSDAFITGVRPALELRAKVQPLAAVQILKQLLKRSPNLIPAAASVAVAGLAHPTPDVQKAALDIIEAHANPDPDLLAAIAAQADLVAPSLQARVQKFLAAHGGDVGGAAQAASADVSMPDPSALPQRWRLLAGVDACIAAHRESRPLPPMAFDAMDIPRLDPANRLTPIANLDELIDRLSSAVERLEDADELELLLDGLSRFGATVAQNPEAYQLRVVPLLKRAEDLAQTDFVANILAALRSLVIGWLKGHSLTPVEGLQICECLVLFLRQRTVLLQDRIRRGMAGPQLACPTHRGGWLCPIEFVRRIAHWQQAHPSAMDAELGNTSPTTRHELIQALLRLAPDNRQAAVAAANKLDLPGEWGSAVRYALGGDEPLGTTASLWIAAARARQPIGEVPALGVFGELGPDGVLSAVHVVELEQREHFGRRSASPVVKVLPAFPVGTFNPAEWKFLVYDRLLQLRHRPARDSVVDVRYAVTSWPANPQAVFAQGFPRLYYRIDSGPSVFEPTSPYLEPWFDADALPSSLGKFVLVLGLMIRDGSTRGLAVDAMVAAAEDGRLDGVSFADAFQIATKADDMNKYKRLATALGEVARVSPVCRRAAAEVVQDLLGAVSELAAEIVPLLTPLYEWLTAGGRGVRASLRPLLESTSGTSKTAKLAKQLLALKDDPTHREFVACQMQLLNARIARAQRWATIAGSADEK